MCERARGRLFAFALRPATDNKTVLFLLRNEKNEVDDAQGNAHILDGYLRSFSVPPNLNSSLQMGDLDV